LTVSSRTIGMVVFSLSNGMLMKLPIKVPIKIRKIIRGVKPMFSKAMLMAPKKTKATTTNNKVSKTAKNKKLCWK